MFDAERDLFLFPFKNLYFTLALALAITLLKKKKKRTNATYAFCKFAAPLAITYLTF